MASASFGIFSKRRNSTKQPVSLSDIRTVTLKEGCSQDRPTFILTGNNFNYNYCMWNSKYYFIDEVVSLHNNLIEVNCILDPLATYKSEILASTQYVCYSSASGGAYLPDTRIPILRDAVTAYNNANIDIIDRAPGAYILSVVGQSGVDTFLVSRSTIQSIIEDLQDWQDQEMDNVLTDLTNLDPTVDSIEAITYEFGIAASKSGWLGNKYEVAVQCIRSCHWVPFDAAVIALGGSSEQIYLGNYPCTTGGVSGTPLTGIKISTNFISGNIPVSIPWHYNDWRRVYCENAYLYLPFVGMISLNVDDIASETQLIIKYSATPSDGDICYEISAGNQIIGTYGGNCKMNIPIGINQQASAGAVFNSLIQAGEKTVSAAVESVQSLNPASWVLGSVKTGYEGTTGMYDTVNVALSTSVSTVGGIGGGAGAGLDDFAKCFTVARNTVVTPSAMAATMGVPTMQPRSLTGLTGYCQCANAHVEAPATAEELNAIDSFLNGGFYIE